MSQNSNPASPNIVYYTVFILVAICALTFYFHGAVYNTILSIKIFEIKIISIFTSRYNEILSWIYNTPVDAMASDNLFQIAMVVGNVIKWVGVVLAIILISIIYYYHPQKNLSTCYSMKSLLEAMNGNFPVTSPVVSENLYKVDINQGDWRMALTPVEFMKINKILDSKKIKNDGRPNLNYGKAYQVFIEQLGRLWQGVEALRPHEKALFAIFSAFSCYKREEAEQALDNLSKQAKSGVKNINYAVTDALLHKYGNKVSVQEVIRKHYYIYTVFSSLLLAARDSGIVAPAGFLWLKKVDRSLWYCLNNVGRRAVFIESAAVRAHWQAELKIGQPISIPMVESAVLNLDKIFDTVKISNA
ncbi:type IVB secretion system coupling complex protein DotM/IcmP [Piscirickettsia salmonis]|uniref:type IVB secretion system coupling complex protein DotM/IcmP n=1 Tax=Piscirickettsia salmonis TaxID=1238 RepID=UPI0007C94D1E|nr:hypothetical protein A0O36_00366 [Piscirickettsiaceae bacterium NZ-RLO1]